MNVDSGSLQAWGGRAQGGEGQMRNLGSLDELLGTRHSDPRLLRYMSGLAVWIISFVLRFLVQPLAPWSPFLLFIPGLMLVAWLWGRGPALLYLATTTVAASIYFVPRSGAFHLNDAKEITTSLQFIVVGSTVMYIVQRLVSARQELARQLRSIRRLSAQQQTLLEEINHRVKNHLQAIVAMTPPGKDERINQIRLRILVLARVYEKLKMRDEAAKVDAEPFLANLTSDFQDSLAPNASVALECSVNCGQLGSKEAVFVGLITNEAVSNALKYAFPTGTGQIAISLREDVGTRTLSIRDDGAGDVGVVKGSGLGRGLISRLAQALGGEARLDSSAGYCVSVTYPVPESAAS